MLADHIAQQDGTILTAIQEAVQAGADWGTLSHIYTCLRASLEVISLQDETRERPVMGVIALGYLSAFGDPDDEEKWRHHIERAHGSLQAIHSILGGLYDILRDIMEEFQTLRHETPRGARIFGFALTRMHPQTMCLAEAASAQP